MAFGKLNFHDFCFKHDLSFDHRLGDAKIVLDHAHFFRHCLHDDDTGHLVDDDASSLAGTIACSTFRKQGIQCGFEIAPEVDIRICLHAAGRRLGIRLPATVASAATQGVRSALGQATRRDCQLAAAFSRSCEVIDLENTRLERICLSVDSLASHLEVVAIKLLNGFQRFPDGHILQVQRDSAGDFRWDQHAVIGPGNQRTKNLRCRRIVDGKVKPCRSAACRALR